LRSEEGLKRSEEIAGLTGFQDLKTG